MGFRIGSFVIAAVLAGSATGADSTLTLDPAASRITFTLKATLHQVSGSFRLVAGEIRFDPETGTAGGRVVVDALSGNTENAKRDKKMHETVLRSGEYPVIVFEPTSFNGTLSPQGISKLQVAGTMQLLGASHPMRFPLEVSIERGEVRARGGFTVPYVEWGLSDPSAFVLRVAKTVDVSLELTGRVDSASGDGLSGSTADQNQESPQNSTIFGLQLDSGRHSRLAVPWGLIGRKSCVELLGCSWSQ